MKFRSSSRTPIGVDVGSRTITAAQLAVENGSALALLSIPRPQPEAEICSDDALALREVLGRQGFKGNRIVLAAPRKAVLPAALELPAKVGGASIDQIVRLELSRLHNLAPDSFEMAYWDLKAAGDAKPVRFFYGWVWPSSTGVRDHGRYQGRDCRRVGLLGPEQGATHRLDPQPLSNSQRVQRPDSSHTLADIRSVNVVTTVRPPSSP